MNTANRIYLYNRYERFWHWSQALLVISMLITGFEVHGSFILFGFEQAVNLHTLSAWTLLTLWAFTIFWQFTTGEWRQYIPSFSKLSAQIHYYTFGMFKGEPYPTHKTARNKLNPLQAVTYLGFKLVMAPLIVVTGMVYMFYRIIDANDMVVVSEIPLEWIAWLHTFGAYLLMMFVVIHVYMTTTGTTPLANIKAMLTGYEELEDTDASNSIIKKEETHEA